MIKHIDGLSGEEEYLAVAILERERTTKNLYLFGFFWVGVLFAILGLVIFIKVL